MSKIVGHISQVIGPVVDVRFKFDGVDAEHALPKIHDAMTIKRHDGRILVVEVQQHIGEDTVRTVAMDSTDGLQRGIHYRMFCRIMTAPSFPITNFKIVSAIRNEIASRLDIDSFQEILTSHRKPYLDNLHVCMTDATRY